MPTIELVSLLVEVSPNLPCGINPEYDLAYIEIEKAARGKPEQQYGNTVIPREDPDWIEVQRLALELFARAKDLRVAVYLTRAALANEGLEAYLVGLQVILGLLEQYWDEVHPQLEADTNDPTMRVNALAPLSSVETGLRELRRANFVAERSAKISVREVEMVLGKAPVSDANPASVAAVAVAVKEARAAGRDPVLLVDRLVNTVKAIDLLCKEKLGDHQAPDFRPLSQLLYYLHGYGSQFAELPDHREVIENSMESISHDGGTAASVYVGSRGALANRTDAIKLLEEVCTFLEHTEPSSPAPLLVRRAIRLIDKSFIEIIRDLVPGSLDRVEDIAGLNDDKS